MMWQPTPSNGAAPPHVMWQPHHAAPAVTALPAPRLSLGRGAHRLGQPAPSPDRRRVNLRSHTDTGQLRPPVPVVQPVSSDVWASHYRHASHGDASRCDASQCDASHCDSSPSDSSHGDSSHCDANHCAIQAAKILQLAPLRAYQLSTPMHPQSPHRRPQAKPTLRRTPTRADKPRTTQSTAPHRRYSRPLFCQTICTSHTCAVITVRGSHQCGVGMCRAGSP